MTTKKPHPLTKLTRRMLPFSDAVSEDLSFWHLMRLSLFQVSVGMATVMLLGTLNRVMIVELSVPAMMVAFMIALPVLIAPLRALLGFRSDNHRSAIGWKRVPYLWFGSIWQMGGLAIMPFALLALSNYQVVGPDWVGELVAAIAFVMTGIGIHMTQTAGLALAADRASEETRPRVVALLYVMFLAGMGVSSLIIGWLLRDFNGILLIRVVQGAAVAGLMLNIIALWKQEKVRPMSKAEREGPKPLFKDAWNDFLNAGEAGRLLVVVFIGTMAFNMQDVLLEPYGGHVLGMSVSTTTLLTAFWALGALCAFALAGRVLGKSANPYAIAGKGLWVGMVAFPVVIFAGPLNSASVFFLGAGLIGFGGGLFAISTLSAAMAMPAQGRVGRGLALGAWGAAQATAAGLSIAAGGALRDWINSLAMSGIMGEALATPTTGYSFVYHSEIVLLCFALVVLGPLVRQSRRASVKPKDSARIGLADFPT